MCDPPPVVSFADALEAVAKLPRHVVEIGAEPDDGGGDGDMVHVISIYEEPPEDGWPTAGHYFGSHTGAIHWTQPPHDSDRYANSVRMSVTAYAANDAARLALNMIQGYPATLARIEADRAAWAASGGRRT